MMMMMVTFMMKTRVIQDGIMTSVTRAVMVTRTMVMVMRVMMKVMETRNTLNAAKVVLTMSSGLTGYLVSSLELPFT